MSGGAGSAAVAVEKPVPANSAEVVAMTKQLAACEAALTQVMDAMMAIRFGLLIAGYPVDLKDALKHPYVRYMVGDSPRVEFSEEALKILKDKTVRDALARPDKFMEMKRPKDFPERFGMTTGAGWKVE